MKTLHLGDCLDVLRDMPACSVDAVVTDPPYGLSFMGKKWDYDVPTVEVWVECLRVLKPGGHLLAFAGTRTQHRMAVRIEDAGFEIRDLIAWVYGSGFPKSLDVSKAVDKANGEADRLHKFTAYMRTTGLTARQINDVTGTYMGSHYLTEKSQPAIPTRALWAQLRPMCGDVPEWVDVLVDRVEAEREITGWATMSDTRQVSPACAILAQGLSSVPRRTVALTAPATDAARQWQGWGTALKPALEPVTMARKPLAGTVASNVLRWGTGAVNVDRCRVVSRWPANLAHDGSDEPADLLGGAARFFYCAKTSKKDRGEGNAHPTVKPTELMRYLCRLVTPPGGTVLDPFMGSGSTGRGARLEGFRFVGIEREPEYYAIAEARIAEAEAEAQTTTRETQPSLLESA